MVARRAPSRPLPIALAARSANRAPTARRRAERANQCVFRAPLGSTLMPPRRAAKRASRASRRLRRRLSAVSPYSLCERCRTQVSSLSFASTISPRLGQAFVTRATLPRPTRPVARRAPRARLETKSRRRGRPSRRAVYLAQRQRTLQRKASTPRQSASVAARASAERRVRELQASLRAVNRAKPGPTLGLPGSRVARRAPRTVSLVPLARRSARSAFLERRRVW